MRKFAVFYVYLTHLILIAETYTQVISSNPARPSIKCSSVAEHWDFRSRD
jgi:hypothetical protein